LSYWPNHLAIGLLAIGYRDSAIGLSIGLSAIEPAIGYWRSGDRAIGLSGYRAIGLSDAIEARPITQ